MNSSVSDGVPAFSGMPISPGRFPAAADSANASASLCVIPSLVNVIPRIEISALTVPSSFGRRVTVPTLSLPIMMSVVCCPRLTQPAERTRAAQSSIPRRRYFMGENCAVLEDKSSRRQRNISRRNLHPIRIRIMPPKISIFEPSTPLNLCPARTPAKENANATMPIITDGRRIASPKSP